MKEITDVTSMGVAVGALLDVLPALAAMFTVGWLAIRIWEKITGREFYTSWLARLLTWTKKDPPDNR